MKDFINDNFFPLTMLAIILTICMTTLVNMYKIEESYKAKENTKNCSCVIKEDLESRK